MSEDTSVKYYNSQMPRAPQIKGNDNHCVRDCIEACLINGFGYVTANTAVVTNGVCRITFNTGESFGAYSTVLVSGATTKMSVNGEHKVKRADYNSIEFTTSESNGNVDGSISVKYAPAGWSLAFPRTTNDMVIRSQAADSDKYFLRFTYNNYQAEQVTGYSDMTNNTTGSNPTTTRYCPKSYDNNATAKQWHLIASDKFFTFAVIPRYAYPNLNQGHAAIQFGDFISEWPLGLLDGCKTLAWGQHNVNRAAGIENSGSTNMGKNYIDEGGGESRLIKDFLTNNYNQVYGTVANSGSSNIINSRNVPSSNTGPLDIDVRNNSIELIPYYVICVPSPYLGQIYGRVPGMYFIRNATAGRLRNTQIYNYAGRDYLPIYTSSSNTYLYDNPHNSTGTCPMFDITGPWE